MAQAGHDQRAPAARGDAAQDAAPPGHGATPPGAAPPAGPTTQDPTTRDPTTRDPTTRDPTTRDPTTRDPTTRDRAALPGRAARAVRRLLVQLLVLAGYLAAGVAVSWPRPTYLTGRLPATVDQSMYVWDFWWVAHQVTHLGNPWFTAQMAAPAGIRLGFDTLMPLPGVLMTPVTLAFGPSASYNLLTILLPGLACYTAYRAARLWLSSHLAAIASGAFYGLSTMLVWQDWYHINIAAGAVFLPLALETSVRLRRSLTAPAAAPPGRSPTPPSPASDPPSTPLPAPDRLSSPSPASDPFSTPTPPSDRLITTPSPPSGHRPGHTRAWWPAVALGLVLGGSLLVNQETAILAVLVAVLALLPWLLRGRPSSALLHVGLAAGIAVVVASPQLVAMVQQALAGGTSLPPHQLARWDATFGVPATSLFAPSPRTADFGLAAVASLFHYPGLGILEGAPTFGVILSALGIFGLVVSWRRASARLLALLWAASAVLALGTSLKVGSRQFRPLPMHWHGVRVSAMMPYTWIIHVPGLSGFREADRFALLGLLPAALLAGKAVEWLARRTPMLLAAALALAVLEAGFSGAPSIHTTPTAMPRLDAPIAADHSRSIVMDVPYGLRGGVAVTGKGLVPGELVPATADGHPRAISYTSWVSAGTARAIFRHPFYRWLVAAQGGKVVTPAQVRAARRDAARMGVRWAIVWRRTGIAGSYLARVGFVYGYRVGHVEVFRLPSAG